MRRLVVAPHMDDESLGCGGLLSKFARECVVVTMTDSGLVRSAERDTALRILGSPGTLDLGFEDGQLSRDMPHAVDALDRALADYRPEEVYLPFPSLHQDHIATYEAGMRAARISMDSNHWYPPSVYVYDIAVYDLDLYPNDLRWNVFEALDSSHVEAKQQACLAYASESPGGVHPMSSIRELCAAIGRPRLLEYAEQFALVRVVRA